MYIDTHTHYDNVRYKKNYEQMLDMIQEDSNIEYIINVPISYTSNQDMRKMMKHYDKIRFAVGIHPTAVEDWREEEVIQIEKHLLSWGKETRTVAVGETGLDYTRISGKSAEGERQKWWFKKHITLSKQLRKPLILHIRAVDGQKDAEEDAIKLLKEERIKGKEYHGVLHCFSHPDHVEEWMDLGFYFGIGGIITKSRQDVTKALKAMPLEKMVLETDCPFLKPEGFLCAQNNSQSIPLVIRKLAEIKGFGEEEIERITTKNARDVFRLPDLDICD